MAAPILIYGQSQVYFSETWTQDGGEMAMFYKNSSVTDDLRNVYVAGSTINSSNNHDIIIQKFDPSGGLLWEETFNGNANMDDMAADLFVDDNYNVYITGTSIENPVDNLDLVVLKYNSNGVLQWSSYYDNGGSPTPMDAGTAITGDNNGNIYVTGSSAGLNSMADYVTLRLDAVTGNQVWESRYDYSQLNDIPAKIQFKNNQLLVSGASQIDPYKWELATLIYTASNGSLTAKKRTHGNATTGLNEVYDLTIDDAGNVYLTGAVNNQNTGYDITVYKLDDQLNILWEEHFDGYGEDDRGKGIKVDNQGNVYVAGYVTSPTEGKNYALLKYNSTGTLQWSREFNGQANLDDEAVQLVIDNQQNIFVTGSARNSNDADFQTLGYKANGELFTQAVYQGADGLDDKPTGIAIDLAGDIIVVGQTESANGKYRTETVKYRLYEKPLEPVFVNGNPSHNANEVIIRFDRSAVNYSVIDKKGFIAGQLSDFVNSQTLNAMSVKLKMDVSRLETFKIFRRMTTADSLTITRLGDTIKVDDFWATLSVIIPTNNDVEQMANSLSMIFPTIQYAEPNYIGEMFVAPNDFIYSNSYPDGQTGLFNSIYGIEVEKAWDQEVVGENTVKVGVFDSGINWKHEDFGGPTWAGSKVVGGWDFYHDIHPSNQATPDPHGHGTAVAGIIGALRNNNIGVAGIAGGDVQAGNTGCQLYSFGIPTYVPLFPNEIVSVLHSDASAAIIAGALSTTGSYGYGLNIQNHSWGSIYNSATLKNAVETCYENSCIFVAASGNYPQGTCQTVTCIMYPASYKDEWVLKVGANDLSGERVGFSAYGNNIDVIAPGTSDIYASLDHNNNSGYSYNHDGTSFAAPHVSGVAALFQSEHNINNGYPNNLAPEDVEYFLENFATTPYSGHNQEIGFGRVNADLSLNRLSLPDYYVLHSGGQAAPLQSIASNLQVILPYNIDGMAAGQYTADRYQITYNFLDILPPGQTTIDIWERYSSSIGVSAANPISEEKYFNYTSTINQNVVSIATTTYCWHILTANNNQIIDKWIPAPPNELKTSYSLYIQDATSTASIEESNLEKGIVIYPNPSDDQVTIDYNLSENADVYLEIWDATGRKIATHEMKNQSIGKQSMIINISHLSNGIYICNMVIGEDRISRKIIKK